MKKIILAFLFFGMVALPIGGIWGSISGTKSISNDNELVEFINRHGGKGEGYAEMRMDHNANMQATSMELVLTPKGRFAVLKDGLLNGLGAGILFAILAYFWRGDFTKKES